MEAVEFRQGWSVSTRRGREKEKKTTKEGVLPPQEGDVRKIRKEKDQGRREGGSREGKVPCAPTQKFLFWFTIIWALRDPSRLNIGSYET